MSTKYTPPFCIRILKKHYKELLVGIKNSKQDIEKKELMEKLKCINMLIREVEMHIYILEHKKNET